MAFLLLVIGTNYTMLRQRDFVEQGSHGIIMEKSSLFSGVDTRSQILQEVDPGIKAEVLDSLDSWYKISLPDREQGWMKKDKIGIIK